MGFHDFLFPGISRLRHSLSLASRSLEHWGLHVHGLGGLGLFKPVR